MLPENGQSRYVSIYPHTPAYRARLLEARLPIREIDKLSNIYERAQAQERKGKSKMEQTIVCAAGLEVVLAAGMLGAALLYKNGLVDPLLVASIEYAGTNGLFLNPALGAYFASVHRFYAFEGTVKRKALNAHSWGLLGIDKARKMIKGRQI